MSSEQLTSDPSAPETPAPARDTTQARSQTRVAKWIALSTGSVGGAVIMFLLNFLLGKDAPWFVERLDAHMRGVGRVSVNVNDLKSGRFDSADANIYHVNRRAGYFAAKPKDTAWGVTTANPGALPPDISLATIPFMKFSMQQMTAAFRPNALKRDEIELTTIAAPHRQHQFVFSADSTVDGLPIGLNPSADPDLIGRVLEAQRAILIQSGLQEEVVDIKLKELHESPEFADLMKKQFEAVIKANWPEPLMIADGVSVLTLRRDAVNRALGVPASLQSILKGTHLLDTLQKVAMLTGNMFWLTGLKRIEVSADNDVLLAESRTELTKVEINKTRYEQARIERVILVVVTGDFVHVVLGRFVDGVTGSPEAAELVQATIRSFRLAE